LDAERGYLLTTRIATVVPPGPRDEDPSMRERDIAPSRGLSHHKGRRKLGEAGDVMAVKGFLIESKDVRSVVPPVNKETLRME
jgi:hypothetical protein